MIKLALSQRFRNIHRSIHVIDHTNRPKHRNHIRISIDTEKALDETWNKFMKRLLKWRREMKHTSIQQGLCMTHRHAVPCGKMWGFPTQIKTWALLSPHLTQYFKCYQGHQDKERKRRIQIEGNKAKGSLFSDAMIPCIYKPWKQFSPFL